MSDYDNLPDNDEFGDECDNCGSPIKQIQPDTIITHPMVTWLCDHCRADFIRTGFYWTRSGLARGAITTIVPVKNPKH